jgi:nitroreductase
MTDAKRATTAEPINDLLATRWSPRAIDQELPVERAQITALLEAARWAPSCFGDQPWRFLVWDRFFDEAGWQAAFDCLAEGNQAWVRRAPVLMAALADSQFRRNGKPNRWGQYDTGAASENLCLQATALGLVAHQMGGFDGNRLAAAFGVPERFTPMAMIAVGHPADASTLPEDRQEDERAPRKRRPLEEIAFQGHWDAPYAS